jgi:hypothetical protein
MMILEVKEAGLEADLFLLDWGRAGQVVCVHMVFLILIRLAPMHQQLAYYASAAGLLLISSWLTINQQLAYYASAAG